MKKDRHKDSSTLLSQFFDLGQQESVSPFLEKKSKNWSVHLFLKASILATLLLIVSFTLSFFPETKALSHLTLVFIYFLAGIPSLIESNDPCSLFFCFYR